MIWRLRSYPLSPSLLHFPCLSPRISSEKAPVEFKGSLFEQLRRRGERDSEMASTSAVSMALPIASASSKSQIPSSDAFFKPLPVRKPLKAITGTSSRANSKLQVQASLKEKAVTGLTAAAMTAYMVIPEVAEAAGSDLSPSLKNFLLSIVAGGVVLVVIFGAVIGVANFDPVKRT